MKKFGKNRGITLVALVVTIIILLVLAGVAISFAAGENGVLGKASKASQEQDKATATEQINLKLTNVEIEAYAESLKMPSLQRVADALCEDEDIQYVTLESKGQAALEKIVVGESESIFTKLKEYPYEFEINSSLQLASIDGVEIADSGDSASSEEVEALKATVAELQTKLETLESSVESVGDTYATKEELSNASGTLNVVDTVLWERRGA